MSNFLPQYFITPKSVKIKDPFLGTLNRVLQLVFVSYFLYDLVPAGNNSAQYFEEPKGTAQFWANSNELADMQGVAKSDLDYCAAGVSRRRLDDTDDFDDDFFNDDADASSTEQRDTNYGDKYCQQTRDAGFGIFCEFNVKCRNFDFAELNIKGESEMFFMTINKDVEVHYGECGDAFRTACEGMPVVDANDGMTVGEEAETRYDIFEDPRDRESEFMYASSESGQCTCSRMQNEYAQGVTGMSLAFGHSYSVSSRFPEEERSGVKVYTTIHRGGDVHKGGKFEEERSCVIDGTKRTPCTFSNGENVQMGIQQWLDIAGIGSLDDNNAAGMVGRPPFSSGEAYLPYRTSGIEMHLDLQWMNSHSEDSDGPVELHVFVTPKGGWHSKGSEVHYEEYPVADATTGTFSSGIYHDRYKRGIKFRFTYGGAVSTFDFAVFVLKLTSLTVMLSISESIVSLFAFSLMGYKSKVYARSQTEEVSVERLHAKIATQAVIATASFNAIAGNDADADTISREDIVTAFMKQGIEKPDAEKLSAHIMLHGTRKGEDIMSYASFADLFGSDEVSIDDVIEHLKAPLDETSVTMGPPKPAASAPGGMLGRFAQGLGALAGPPQASTYTIKVPSNAAPGSIMAFMTKDGRQVQIKVPEGAVPGETSLTVQA